MQTRLIHAAAIAATLLPAASWSAPARKRPAKPPPAPPATFVEVPTRYGFEFDYIDTASIVRGKDETTFSLLTLEKYFTATPPATLRRYSMACGWGTYRAVPGWITYDAKGLGAPSDVPQPETKTQYPYPGSVLSSVFAMACDPAAISPMAERLTFRQAFDRATEALKTAIPPLPVPPVERRGGGGFPKDVLRLSVIATGPDGQKRLIDWANMQRGGGKAAALDVDTPASNAQPGRIAVRARSVVYDCTERTVTFRRTFGYSITGTLVFQAPDEPARPAAVGSADAAELDAACHGVEPKAVYASVGDAVAALGPPVEATKGNQ
ncbi:hypothetical protein [Phenylobacterium sp.]|uniref:hypothetical protein n=1 Tax=Phenylobacterium sp. TaxID=1871053 RepID=UPI002F4204F5